MKFKIGDKVEIRTCQDQFLNGMRGTVATVCNNPMINVEIPGIGYRWMLEDNLIKLPQSTFNTGDTAEYQCYRFTVGRVTETDRLVDWGGAIFPADKCKLIKSRSDFSNYYKLDLQIIATFIENEILAGNPSVPGAGERVFESMDRLRKEIVRRKE